MEKIKHYDGLYGDMEHQPHAGYIFSELIETRSRNFNWSIQPHFHTRLFQLFCIESGQLELTAPINGEKLQMPCVLVIPPTVVHGFEYSSDVEGRILTVSEPLLENIFQHTSAMTVAMNDFQCVSFESRSSTAFEAVIRLMQQIDEELFANRAEKNSLLQALFSQLFILLYRQLQTNKRENIAEGHHGLQYLSRFQKSIKNSVYPKSIPEFAAELSITSVHLNRICRALSGKSASQMVQEHLIQQAQKYLIHTTYTVSEISYLLKFEYPNYFAKLFRKHTGMAPKTYREQNQGKV
jgi:AraC family transcriptional activator of pobA